MIDKALQPPPPPQAPLLDRLRSNNPAAVPPAPSGIPLNPDGTLANNFPVA